MRYRVAVEDIEPDHWIAWLLDLPGCYSAARTSAEAIAQAPAKIARYYEWIAQHDPTLSIPTEPIEIDLAETFQAFPSKRDPEYIVNAFFDDDKRPVGYWDVVIAQRLLAWSHATLRQVLQATDKERLEQALPGEVRASIAGLVEHVAVAENWYLSRLELGLDRGSLPEDPWSKLEIVRHNTQQQLWKLIGETRIVEHYDERWSARKIIRRALWHERDHTQQIEHLLERGSSILYHEDHEDYEGREG